MKVPMKKISHIKELKQKQHTALQHARDLEVVIKREWHSLKEDLRPANNTTTIVNALVSGGLSLGGNMLAGKLMGLAGRGIWNLLKRAAVSKHLLK
jgi:hypothetical protein